MTKAEALAKQERTIVEREEEDRGSEIRAIAEEHTGAEFVQDGRDYEPDEIRKLIPFGSYLRDLEVTHQTLKGAQEAKAAEKAADPEAEYPADAA